MARFFSNSNNIVLYGMGTEIDGPLRQIQYFSNGNLLGAARRAPYRASWNNVAVGNYALTAVATDLSGRLRNSPTVNITVQYPPPPNDNFANRSIINGSLVTITNSMFMATLEPGEPSHGDGGAASIWWSWTAPDSGSVTITASVPDSIDVFVGTSLKSLTSVASGSTATFNATAGTTYAIAASGPPTGEVTINLALYAMQLGSPTNGAHFPVGSNIPLGVVAPTNHISLYHVAYYANGTLLGNTIRAPFSLLWTNPPSGVYAVTAVAGDSQNHTIQSRPISITVTPTNDDFTNRTMITGANLTLTNSLAGATLESGETALGGSDANGG